MEAWAEAIFAKLTYPGKPELNPWELQRLGISASREAWVRWAQETEVGISSPAEVQSIKSSALRIIDVPLIPPKREWLHGSDLARGAVTLLVAPGGKGKSSWLVGLALAAASGRGFLGSHVFGGPLKVLMINAEDSSGEVALKFRAAMKHHGFADSDVPGLMLAGADRVHFSLLRSERGATSLDESGWNKLRIELEHAQPDLLILDPLVALTGGTSLNDNAGAALLMGGLVRLAAERRCAVVIAHHASKGRDLSSAEAAMGAASLTNLARIALAVEPLTDNDAAKLGLLPFEARSVFRVSSTKANLAPPDASDRWFRIVSVDMNNAAPPTYPNGDLVGVVEKFIPGIATNATQTAILQAALHAIKNANPPLSPSVNSSAYAGPAILAAIKPLLGRPTSLADAKAILSDLIRQGAVSVAEVAVSRPGRGTYMRTGLTAAPDTPTPPPGVRGYGGCGGCEPDDEHPGEILVPPITPPNDFTECSPR